MGGLLSLLSIFFIMNEFVPRGFWRHV